MNELQVFNNPDFGSVRTVTVNNTIYFIGKDVAEILGYSNPSKAIRDHVDDEDKTTNESFAVNGIKFILITESGLYSLILSSRQPKAKQFKRWITNDVIPSIRVTGAYMTPETIEKVLYNPDMIIGLAQQVKSLQSELLQDKQVIDELAPKAEYTETILNSTGLVTITQIAKDYGMSGKKMNILLKEYGVQFLQNGQWLLYSRYQCRGYTHSQTVNITRSDGRSDSVMETKWTQKGRKFIYELLKANGILPIIEQQSGFVLVAAPK